MKLFDTVRSLWMRIAPPVVEPVPITLAPVTTTDAAAEVFDERAVMSAERYVAHMKEKMEGPKDPEAHSKERAAFSRYILSLAEDDARLFFYDVDKLIDAGKLVHVLTEEEHLEKRKRIWANIDHWRAEASKLGKDYGVPPELMQRVMAGENVTFDDIDVTDEEVDAWSDDEEDDDDCRPETRA